MAIATGLMIFAAVIGSHVFLWWSCRRGGGSSRNMTVQFTGSPTSMNKPGDGVASRRENHDCYQYSDDETIFLAHRVFYRLATGRVDVTKDLRPPNRTRYREPRLPLSLAARKDIKAVKVRLPYFRTRVGKPVGNSRFAAKSLSTGTFRRKPSRQG